MKRLVLAVFGFVLASAWALGQGVQTGDITGTVKLQGEIWNAESLAGRIDKGETVVVKGIRNLKVYVEKEATNSK